MSRIAHSVPMKAYDHVSKLLEEAGGKDGVISRDDAKKLVEQLKKEGRIEGQLEGPSAKQAVQQGA